MDGPWKPGLYTTGNIVSIASGLVWQLLGSPRASDRWRAAHSVRCFARLGRWEIIDALVGKLESKESRAFGAPELPFFYLHARLWLLIALARIALDSPEEIAKHHGSLIKIAIDSSQPHVVIRHFAAQAVLTCDETGTFSLSNKRREELRTLNDSTLPHSGKRERHYGYSNFYEKRPTDAADRDERFHLDYDFDKYDVRGLADVFAQPGWSLRDLVTGEVRGLDSSVASMYDKAGRDMTHHRSAARLVSSFHVYGQYLAWHALRIVAGRLLTQHPITERWEHGRPWIEWLTSSCLLAWMGYGFQTAWIDHRYVRKLMSSKRAEKDLS